MSIFSHILVGTDGSEAADEAVDFAARLAHEHDGELILCYAVNWLPPVANAADAGSMIDPAPILAELRAAGEAYIDRAARRAKAAGVAPQHRVVEGAAAPSILDLARDEGCTLIVMATHGRAGLEHFFVGSTTEAVLRGSTIPVLTIRAGKHTARPGRCFERIIVGIDDSEPSDAALATVVDFPAEDRRHVLLCGVAGSAFVVGGREYRQAAIDELHEETERVVETALATAGKRGRSFEVRVVDGRTAPALIAAAEQEKADLIVLGSHGRRGLRRLFLGSVAENVVQSASIPVLVVRGLQNKNRNFTDSSRRLATMSA
jgi:nucleotide-binding universal stress UspA family protein